MLVVRYALRFSRSSSIVRIKKEVMENVVVSMSKTPLSMEAKTALLRVVAMEVLRRGSKMTHSCMLTA